MDYRSDILVNVATFLADKENKPSNSTIYLENEEYFGTMRYQPTTKGCG